MTCKVFIHCSILDRNYNRNRSPATPTAEQILIRVLQVLASKGQVFIMVKKVPIVCHRQLRDKRERIKHSILFRETITLLPLYYYTCFHTYFIQYLISSTRDSTITDTSEGIPLTQPPVIDPVQAIFKHLSKPDWQAQP